MCRLVWSVALAVACTPAKTDAPGPTTPTSSPSPPAPPAARTVPALDAVLIGSVPDGTYGPYLGDGPSGTVAIWAAVVGDRRQWFSAVVGSAAPAEPMTVTQAPSEVGLVVVRGFGSGSNAGYTVMFTRPASGGQTVEAFTVGTGGQLVGQPAALSESPDDVVWVESVPTSRGAIALWAVRQGDRADVYAAELGSGGSKVGGAGPVFRHVRAWQAVATDSGLAIAAVTAGKDPGMPGPVKLLRLDGSAKPVGTPIVLSHETTAELDLDAVRIGENIVVGWSDYRRIEPRIFSTVLDSKGVVKKAAAPMMDALGEQALIRLVPAVAGGAAYVAWENVGARAAGGRDVTVAKIAQDGSVGEGRGLIRMASDDGTLPELAATKTGIAALTLARVCARGADCAEADLLPTFVELDENFDVAASEPMFLTALGGASELSWGLTCRASGCIALAAQATAPAPVYAVTLEAKSNHYRAAAERVVAPKPPRASKMEAIAATDPLSDVDAAQMGESTLAAWVTFFDHTTPYVRRTKPAPDGRFDPLRALVQVASNKTGGTFSTPQTISLRARTLGGVALAPGGAAHKETLLAWTAVDRKIPQVFVTVLGDDGAKRRQQMLTRSKGEVSDVAAAYSGDDGWIVGWVDDRHGDPEVYAAKVTRLLARTGADQRVTSTKGGATGVTMLARGKEVFTAWSDSRDSADPGRSDIYFTRLASNTATPIGAAVRVAATPAHSHSPALGVLEEGAVIAWVESEPEPAVGLATVSSDGKVGAPTYVKALGRPRSASVDCQGRSCRVVFSTGIEGRSELHAFTWTPGGAAPSPTVLWKAVGPGDQSVAPAVVGDGLLFADQTRDAKGRVRWLTVQWGSE